VKKIILLLSLAVTIIAANAQEAPPKVPPIKNVIDTKLPQLPQQPIEIPGGRPIKLPSKPDPITTSLTTHTWNLIRWWVTPNAGHSITDPSFKFLSNGTVSCSLTTPEAVTRLESGTYTVHGNNVTILLKKNTNVTMNCNLIYNNSNKTLTGTYTLQVLPVTNAPAGYTPGTVTGELKLEIKS
jgi:hypothetical protein